MAKSLRAKYLRNGAKINKWPRIYTAVGPHGVLDPVPDADDWAYFAAHPSFVVVETGDPTPGPVAAPESDTPDPENSESDTPDPENSESDAPDLSAMSYKDLRSFGKEKGVKYSRGMDRQDYEAAVKAALEA